MTAERYSKLISKDDQFMNDKWNAGTRFYLHASSIICDAHHIDDQWMHHEDHNRTQNH